MSIDCPPGYHYSRLLDECVPDEPSPPPPPPPVDPCAGLLWPAYEMCQIIQAPFNAVNYLINAVVSTAQGVITGAISITEDIIDGLISTAQGVITGAIFVVEDVITGAISITQGAIDGFISVAQGVITGAIVFAQSTIKGAIVFAQSAIDGLISVAQGVITGAIFVVETAVDVGFTAITTAVDAVAGTVFDSLTGLASDILIGITDALGPVLQFIWTGLADTAGTIATGIISVTDELGATLLPFMEASLLGILDAASDAMSLGSPPKEVKKTAEKWTKALEEAIKRPIPKKGKSPPDLPTLAAASAAVVTGITGVYSVTHAISGALDAIHPAKKWGFKAAIMDIIHTISIDDAVGPMVQAPLWAGVIVPMRMRYRQLFPYEVPGMGELARMATQRIIPDALYKENMSFHAIDATWSEHLQTSAERVPSFGDMSRMMWLGDLTMDQLLDAQRHMGIREEFIAGYEALTERLPGAGDLITMMVREVIDLALFVETMTMQGVSETWSMRHYEAHWILLPLGKVQDARYRGLIDDAELAKYLVLHDYKPEPRPGITLSDQDLAGKLIWKIPGKIEARWMYKWGDIGLAELEALLISDGMDPDWAPIVARATARNQMLAEINRLRDNSKKDFVKGLITEEQMRVNLEALRYSAELIEFHVADALADGERDLKLEAIDMIVDGYVKDMITDAELASGLGYYIVRPEVLASELDRAYVRKWRKPKVS